MEVQACKDARHRCFICRGDRPEIQVMTADRPVALHRACASQLVATAQPERMPPFSMGVRVQNMATGVLGTVTAQNGTVVHITWDGLSGLR